MSVDRREFLTGAAAFAAALAASSRVVEGGDPSFSNNVPDPLLSGKELPTFKYALEKSEGKVIGGSFGKEATVEQLPISKGIAGVSMKLEPGAMRELHWHATAAEWQYVISGRVRMTLFGAHGRSPRRYVRRRRRRLRSDRLRPLHRERQQRQAGPPLDRLQQWTL